MMAIRSLTATYSNRVSRLIQFVVVGRLRPPLVDAGAEFEQRIARMTDLRVDEVTPEAVQRGRLPASAVAGLLPYQQTMFEAQGKDAPLLPSTTPSQKQKQFLAELKKIVMNGKVGNGTA